MEAITENPPFIQHLGEDPGIQIGPVGAYRLPNIFLLDLQVERAFPIGSTITISPMLNCFNVANSHTVLAQNGFVGVYNAALTPAFAPAEFNQPLQRLNGRVFRGGVRVAF